MTPDTSIHGFSCSLANFATKLGAFPEIVPRSLFSYSTIRHWLFNNSYLGSNRVKSLFHTMSRFKLRQGTFKSIRSENNLHLHSLLIYKLSNSRISSSVKLDNIVSPG